MNFKFKKKEMKNILLITIFSLIASGLFAQIDPELLLELRKGTTLEMNAITPAIGVLLYNIDDDKVYRFDGTNWLAVGEDGDWTRTGNDQYSAVSGNVGIGTVTPKAKLDVEGIIRSTAQVSPSSGTGAELTWDGTYAVLRGYDRTSSAFKPVALSGSEVATYIDGAEKMIVNNAGDVGIGTHTPIVHLDNNTSSISANVEISTTGKTGVAGRTDLALFSDLDGSNPTNIFLQGKLSTGRYGWATWSFRGNHILNEYKDWVDFGVNDGATTTKEQMIRMNVLNGDVVFNEGKVGVGITAPTKKLDVQGDIALSGSMFSRGPNYTYEWMSFEEDSSGWGNSLVLGAGGLTILGAGEFSYTAKPQFTPGSESLVLGSDYNVSFYTNTQSGWSNNIHAMEITKNGNVGVGTATPLGNLHVSAGTSGDAKLIIEADTDNDNENDNPMIIFKQDGGVEESAIVQEHNTLHIKNGISLGGIVFDVGGASGYSSATEAMRISSTGDVGINTPTPRSDLDLNGVLIEGNSKSTSGNQTANTIGSCVKSHGIATFFTNTQDNNYMHIKLPYNVNTDNHMYYIHATGYRYNSTEIIDITWVGYCYAGSGNLIRTSNSNNGGPNFSITQYVGSDNFIYLRFRGTVGSNYYQSFRIDSMKVGNGTVLKEGDIQIISSAAATL